MFGHTGGTIRWCDTTTQQQIDAYIAVFKRRNARRVVCPTQSLVYPTLYGGYIEQDVIYTLHHDDLCVWNQY